jgi:transcriptional regulator with XRE-family HTH domain
MITNLKLAVNIFFILFLKGASVLFYSYLKKACAKNKTTPTAVAREVGITTANTGKWKNGGTPSVDILLKLSDRLSVSTDYLLKGEEPHSMPAKKEVNSVNTHIMKKRLVLFEVFCKGLHSFFYRAAGQSRLGYTSPHEISNGRMEELSDLTDLPKDRLYMIVKMLPRPEDVSYVAKDNRKERMSVFPIHHEFSAMMRIDPCDCEDAKRLLDDLKAERDIWRERKEFEAVINQDVHQESDLSGLDRRMEILSGDMEISEASMKAADSAPRKKEERK